MAVRIGIYLKSAASVPLTFRPETFTLRIGGLTFPLTAELPLEDVAPEQQRGWFRDPHHIPREAFPVTVEIEYVVHYGRRGHKLRRKLDGGFLVTVPLLSPGEQRALFMEELRPTRDERL